MWLLKAAITKTIALKRQLVNMWKQQTVIIANHFYISLQIKCSFHDLLIYQFKSHSSNAS